MSVFIVTSLTGYGNVGDFYGTTGEKRRSGQAKQGEPGVVSADLADTRCHEGRADQLEN